MANYTLLPRQEEPEPEPEKEMKSSTAAAETKNETKPSTSGGSPLPAMPTGWTVDGVLVAGPKVQHRAHWESGVFSCLGTNDEFYSSDLEVCILGGVAPCVLHGSNAERLGSGPGSFSNHCLPYAGLYVLGNCFFGWNCLAPFYSYPNRTTLRRKLSLEGSCEALARSFGCSGSILTDEDQRERCESACDFATHVFCHACALCQEAREVRRKLPHPGVTAKPVFVMLPPGSQTMARGS